MVDQGFLNSLLQLDLFLLTSTLFLGKRSRDPSSTLELIKINGSSSHFKQWVSLINTFSIYLTVVRHHLIYSHVLLCTSLPIFAIGGLPHICQRYALMTSDHMISPMFDFGAFINVWYICAFLGFV